MSNSPRHQKLKPITLQDTIRDLNRLKTDFMRLQFQLKNNRMLIREHELLKSESSKATPFFSAKVIHPFDILCQRYNEIKSQLDQFIPKEEIEQIETSVMNAAKIDDTTLHQLVFFPNYQKMHVKAAGEYKATLEEKIPAMREKRDGIKSRYKERCSSEVPDRLDYKSWHAVAGGCMIIGVGIPFFIGGLMVHLIDCIITHIKIGCLNRTIAKAEHEISHQIHPGLNEFHKTIQHDPAMQLRQSFFSLSKTRHQTCMHELDELHERIEKAALPSAPSL